MKTLYFEGAGCVPRGDLENCRIRTAFSLDNGDKVYLEISATECTKHTSRIYKGFKNPAHIDHLHFIKGYDEEVVAYKKNGFVFDYTRKNLLEFVNSLGASFDEVIILPDLSGYRVHKHGGGYNFADEFIYNVERTEQAEKIKQWYYDREKAKGVRFPCFSIWFENIYESETLNVRFFDGRGTIEIADVFKFDFDSKEGE